MIADLQNVSVRLGRRWALARISFGIDEGCGVVLVGANGAGKTTLLRVLATAIRPSRGKVRLFGLRAADHPSRVRPRIGLVTHDSHLYDDLTAAENLRLVAQLGGFPVSGVEAWLQRVELANRASTQVRGFSAGMKRRLCLARLLMQDPDLVLLDEPFAQLDPGGVCLVEEIIRELRARGKTLVMSTHDIDRGERLCDLRLRLAAGRIVGGIEKVE